MSPALKTLSFCHSVNSRHADNVTLTMKTCYLFQEIFPKIVSLAFDGVMVYRAVRRVHGISIGSEFKHPHETESWPWKDARAHTNQRMTAHIAGHPLEPAWNL